MMKTDKCKIGTIFAIICSFVLLSFGDVEATHSYEGGGNSSPTLPSDSTNYGGKEYWDSKAGAAVSCDFSFPASSSKTSPHGIVTIVKTSSGLSGSKQKCHLESGGGTYNGYVYCGPSLQPSVTVTPQVVGTHYSLRGFVGWAEKEGDTYKIYGYYCVPLENICFGSGSGSIGSSLTDVADPNFLVINAHVECHK